MHAAGLNTKKRSSQQNRLSNDGGGGCDGGGILLHFAAAKRDVNVTKLTVCLFPAFIAKTLCHGCLSHFCAETKRRRRRRRQQRRLIALEGNLRKTFTEILMKLRGYCVLKQIAWAKLFSQFHDT